MIADEPASALTPAGPLTLAIFIYAANFRGNLLYLYLKRKIGYLMKLSLSSDAPPAPNKDGLLVSVVLEEIVFPHQTLGL